MSLSLDIDSASAALISQLTLEDIDEMRSLAKGKAREDSPPSDTECALRAFETEAREALRFFQDLDLARSIDTALELDQPMLSLLSVVEDGFRDDHRYAEALQNGETLPAQSEVQRLLEDPHFSFTPSDDEPDASTEVADTQNEAIISTSNPNERRPVQCVIRSSHRSAQCIICGDGLPVSTSFKAPCKHFYCRECLSNLANSCIGDESLFPLQCCRQLLPMEGRHGVFAQLEMCLQLSLRAKAAEFGTLAKDRLYCPSPTCSTFLGSTAARTEDVACHRCRTRVCVRCKQASHPGRPCTDNAALEQVKALAREKHWQTCPGCSQIIDLQQGCFHMTCRCRTEFCYVCAARWKSCACPQWDEAHLFNTAQQRVQNEMGGRARAAAPAIFQQRVRQRVEQLRYDHDCANGHRWRRRDGRARCEECRFMLPEYLLLCRSCGIAVCVRCARNRL
ncbi:hypothetical protein B0H17DRAFT_950316 [Mycena rosella]|uniref:RBR-type E3 ubiquitin transferase n=1 Tax=Mycena rosella TaxID=1033263 RepID=A0AAD7CX50_MYCRO|nr:hypothetical protein B0H17DRAFT_950316 [Mycena rosella]